MLKQLLLAMAVIVAAASTAAADEPLKVTIQVDASRPLGELRPLWRFFGADEPNYAYMTDGR